MGTLEATYWKKMRVRLLAFLCLVFVAGPLSPASAHTLLGRARINDLSDNDAKYQADVVQQDAANVALTIDCIENCPKPVHYAEKETGILTGLLVLSDGSHDVITLWASEGVTWVRVYHVRDGTVAKVMEAPTKSAPEFTYTPEGPIRIRLDDGVSPPAFWSWNGKVFQPNPAGR